MYFPIWLRKSKKHSQQINYCIHQYATQIVSTCRTFLQANYPLLYSRQRILFLHRRGGTVWICSGQTHFSLNKVGTTIGITCRVTPMTSFILRASPTLMLHIVIKVAKSTSCRIELSVNYGKLKIKHISWYYKNRCKNIYPDYDRTELI